MRLGNFGGGAVVRAGVVLALALGSLAASPALAAASAPTVKVVTPPIGRTSGSTEVEIRGSGFNSVIAVYFGSTPAKSFTVGGPEGIKAVSPPAAGPGTVAVTVETAEGVSEPGEGSSFKYLQPPEFGACVKLGFGNGSFTASGCQTEQRSTFGNSEFEWFPAFESSRPLEKRGIALTAPKGMTLETVGRTQVKCAAGSATAEYAAPKSIALGAMTFTGCVSRTLGTCTGAGAAAGELSFQPLTGTLGVTEIKTGEKAAVGLDLVPASGEAIAEFTCGGAPVSVHGDVIVGLKAPDKMVEKTKWVAGESRGMPKTSFFIGGPEAVLETSVGAGEYERSGLKLNATGLNESVKVEISTKI
jgi:hypothetical protein